LGLHKNPDNNVRVFLFPDDMFFVYLLKSEKDNSFYIGQTNNLKTRLDYHNRGRSQYTKSKRPWIMIAHKMCQSRSEAMIEEKRLKNLKNRQAILNSFGL